MVADTERHPGIIGTVVIHVDTEHFFVGVAGSKGSERLFQGLNTVLTPLKKHTPLLG